MAAKKSSKASDKVRIRMYRVGFGDCFLVTFPNGSHILVDCGVHSQGNIGTMKDVVANIAEETGKKLAVVIATHAHQDHISGFGAFGAQFQEFEIGEVWMPWLMDADHPQAKKLDKKRNALAAALQTHFAATGADAETKNMLINVTGVTQLGAAAGKGGNAAALKLLRSGFGSGKVRYFKAGDSVTNAAGVKGLTAQMLSPSTDESFLSRMDPPLAQRYKLAGGDADVANAIVPFSRYWTMTREQFPDGYSGLPAGEEKSMAAKLEMPMSALALALDNVMNNTSLVVAFQYEEETLLFPGDAQWGNWQSWIEKSDSKDVLSNVTFYKVAHHGSVNATPKSALEAMQIKKFAAMASTQSKPWPSIPAPKLVAALNTRTGNTYVQSDSIKVEKAPYKHADVSPKFKPGDLWYDYFA